MGKNASMDTNIMPKLTVQDGVKHVLYIALDIPFKANSKFNGAYFPYNYKEPSSFWNFILFIINMYKYIDWFIYQYKYEYIKFFLIIYNTQCMLSK